MGVDNKPVRGITDTRALNMSALTIIVPTTEVEQACRIFHGISTHQGACPPYMRDTVHKDMSPEQRRQLTPLMCANCLALANKGPGYFAYGCIVRR